MISSPQNTVYGMGWDKNDYLIPVVSYSHYVPPVMKIFIKNYPDTRGAVVFSRDLENETSYLGKKIFFRKLAEEAEEQ